jgi:hypothetical protein
LRRRRHTCGKARKKMVGTIKSVGHHLHVIQG